MSQGYKTVQDAYKTTQIQTANQGRLIVMLYEGVIRFCHQAIDAIRRRRYDEANNNLVRAEDILTELLLSLDYDQGGDIAKKLASIYIYLNQQLLEANITKTIPPIETVIRLMSDLKDSWEKIANKAPPSDPSDSSKGGLNITG